MLLYKWRHISVTVATMTAYWFRNDVIGMSFCQVLSTTVGYSLVVMVTDLLCHLTNNSRGAWLVVYAMLLLNYKWAAACNSYSRKVWFSQNVWFILKWFNSLWHVILGFNYYCGSSSAIYIRSTITFLQSSYEILSFFWYNLQLFFHALWRYLRSWELNLEICISVNFQINFLKILKKLRTWFGNISVNFQINFLTMFLQRLLNNRLITCLTVVI